MNQFNNHQTSGWIGGEVKSIDSHPQSKPCGSYSWDWEVLARIKGAKILPCDSFSYSDSDSTIRYIGDNGDAKTIIAESGFVFRFYSVAGKVMYYQEIKYDHVRESDSA